MHSSRNGLELFLGLRQLFCAKKNSKSSKNKKINFWHLYFTKLSDVRMSYGPTLQLHTIAYKWFYSQIEIQHIWKRDRHHQTSRYKHGAEMWEILCEILCPHNNGAAERTRLLLLPLVRWWGDSEDDLASCWPAADHQGAQECSTLGPGQSRPSAADPCGATQHLWPDK